MNYTKNLTSLSRCLRNKHYMGKYLNTKSVKIIYNHFY